MTSGGGGESGSEMVPSSSLLTVYGEVGAARVDQ